LLSIYKNSKALCILFLALTTSGCATGARLESMTYTGIQKEYDSGLENEINILSATGGQETNPLWTSQISSIAFYAALQMSLSNQGLFSETGEYQLSAQLVDVNQPFFGVDFTVTTSIRYTLEDREDNSILMSEIIVAPYTATLGDSFLGVERLRLANEGSARENISRLLERLSNLKISPDAISLK
jgi:hypothetical protein